jgi:hypothetical protein
MNLDKVIGMSTNNKQSIALDPQTGEIVYPAGSILVFYDPYTNK